MTVLAKGQSAPQPMTVSGGYVYWYDDGTGKLDRVSESGGKVQTLATGSTGFGVAVEGHYAFWLDSSFGGNTSLLRTDLVNKSTEVLYTTWSEGLMLGPIAVNGDHVFFAGAPNIYRIDANGSDLVTLADDPSPCPGEVTYSAGVVYWLDACTGQVGSVPAAGGTPKILSPVLSDNGSSWVIGVTQIVVAGGHVYWTFNGLYNGSVDAVSTSGKGFRILYSIQEDGGPEFGGLSYWHGNVLFADQAKGAILSVAQNGGKVHVAVRYPAIDLEVIGGTIFLTSDFPGTVAKTPA